LNYNQTISQAKLQERLGWQVKISVEPAGNNLSRFRLDVKDAQNNPIQNAEISADFKRPTQEGYDFSSAIDFDGKTYVKEISFPLKGQWNIELTITKNGQIFKTAQRRVIH
jgi:nitrogen fixation protein FixH